jgi:hypothetical protein
MAVHAPRTNQTDKDLDGDRGMTLDRWRSELEARSSAPPRFTQLATMTNILLNLRHTTMIWL